MKQRTLKIRLGDDDPTPIKLNEKEHKTYVKAVQNLSLALNTLGGSLYEKGEGVQNTANTICASLDLYAADIQKILKYDSKLLRDKEERYKEIRELNQENRELREEIGKAVTNDHLREKLKCMVKTIENWWNDNHLGYSEVKFYGSIIHVEFKVAMYIHLDLNTAAEQEEFIKKHSSELGLKLAPVNPNRYETRPDLIDNEHNKKIIDKLVKARFPSAKIDTIQIRYTENDMGEATSRILSFSYYLRNYDEV